MTILWSGDDNKPDEDWSSENMRKFRNAVIEECAQMADCFASIQSNPDFQAMFEDVAAAIRALKDKP